MSELRTLVWTLILLKFTFRVLQSNGVCWLAANSLIFTHLDTRTYLDDTHAQSLLDQHNHEGLY